MVRIAETLLICLIVMTFTRMASAQSNCKQAKGDIVEAFNPAIGASTGTLTNGGLLDGTTTAVFNSVAFPTPSLTQVTFASRFTLAANQGELQGAAVYLLDVASGQGTVMVTIDPAASTGSLAGATGVLFLNLTHSESVAFGPYYERVDGQICFSR